MSWCEREAMYKVDMQHISFCCFSMNHTQLSCCTWECLMFDLHVLSLLLILMCFVCFCGNQLVLWARCRFEIDLDHKKKGNLTSAHRLCLHPLHYWASFNSLMNCDRMTAMFCFLIYLHGEVNRRLGHLKYLKYSQRSISTTLAAHQKWRSVKGMLKMKQLTGPFTLWYDFLPAS